MSLDTQHLDIADPALYEHGGGPELWTELRASPGLHWNRDTTARSGFWAVTRYDDAIRVYRDSARFSSEGGMRLDTEPNAIAAAAGRMLIVTDQPRHGKLRAVLASTFSPQGLRKLRAGIDEVAMSLVVEATERGRLEFVNDVAAKLPVAVVCSLLGVPRNDWSEMHLLTSTAFGNTHAGEAERAAAHASIFMYYAELIEDRRKSPADDLVSLLTQAQIDERLLTDDEIVLNCDGLLTGGNETTRHASSRAAQVFAERPEAWEVLKTHPEMVPTAVEELLRWASPGLHVLRTATTRILFDADTEILPGQQVAIWNGAANRDPDAFDAAEEFDVGRSPNRHLALGYGRHACLGGALARFELEALLRALLSTVDSFELDGKPIGLRSNFMWGLVALPVILNASAR